MRVQCAADLALFNEVVEHHKLPLVHKPRLVLVGKFKGNLEVLTTTA